MKEITQDDVDRMEEIMGEMKELLEEAVTITRSSPGKITYDRAKAYWIAQISIALDDDHGYVGGAGCSMQQTIGELESQIEGGDEDIDEDED